MYLCDGGRCVYLGGISGSKEGQKVAKPQDYKREYFLNWECIKVESRKFLRSRENFLVPSMMSLLSLPHWSCSRQWFGLWVMQSTQRSALKFSPVADQGSVWPPYASNLTRKGNAHIWPVISYFWATLSHSWIECLVETEVLKVLKGERSLQDQTGMCNKSYSLFKLIGLWFCFTLLELCVLLHLHAF